MESALILRRSTTLLAIAAVGGLVTAGIRFAGDRQLPTALAMAVAPGAIALTPQKFPPLVEPAPNTERFDGGGQRHDQRGRIGADDKSLAVTLPPKSSPRTVHTAKPQRDG